MFYVENGASGSTGRDLAHDIKSNAK